MQLDTNRGYAGNNNVGIKAAMDRGADWILVLNEDTILAPDCLTHLIEVAENDHRIGIVGPLVFHHDEPNVIQSAGGHLSKYWVASHRGQNEVDYGQFAMPSEVEWISGCAIMVRHIVIDQVGMLDERFFYYCEETEWCLRARQNGWTIMHVPQAKVWHKGVQRDYQPNANVSYYGTRNRFLMLTKHRAPLTAWLVAWSQILRTLASWSIRPKWQSMQEHRNAMLQGVLDFLLHRWGMRS
jgi:GT2 family glycosyltransferase